MRGVGRKVDLDLHSLSLKEMQKSLVELRVSELKMINNGGKDLPKSWQPLEKKPP
jgi:hypothetical protein